MNITRTMTMIRSGQIWGTLQFRFNHRVELTIAALFAWALSKQAVQHAIVDAFTTRFTPMCDALHTAVRSAVESEMQGMQINADDVEGLSSYIEDGIEQAINGLDVSDIKEFEDAVERVVNGMETKDIVDNVMEDLIERLQSR